MMNKEEKEKIGYLLASKLVWQNRKRLPAKIMAISSAKLGIIIGIYVSVIGSIITRLFPDLLLTSLLIILIIISPISFYIGYRRNLYLIEKYQLKLILDVKSGNK